MESRSEAMAARIKVLEIIHQEPELTIGFGDGASRTVFTDGRKMEESSEVGVFEGKGKWKGSSLVFNYESLRGKVTETYELNPAGDLLTVTTKMEGDGRRPGVTFARIYDRVAPEIPVEPDPEPAGN